MMQIDLKQMPFSRFGSYLSLRHLRERHVNATGGEKWAGLFLRSHHAARLTDREVAFVELLIDGDPVLFDERCTPDCLRLYPKGGTDADDQPHVDICFASPGTLRFRGEHAGVRLSAVLGTGVVAHEAGGGRWMLNARPAYQRFMLEPLSGEFDPEVAWAKEQCEYIHFDVLPGEGGVCELAVDEMQSSWEPHQREAFDTCRRGAAASFEEFVEGTVVVPQELAEARLRAAYVNWSSVVAPRGLFKRHAMLMSKNWMDNVWSWDHCFNAMALVHHQPKLAWRQMLVKADVQDEFGAFPDATNDMILHFNYCKPPVHGWALGYLWRARPDFFTKRKIKRYYKVLKAWSAWWLKYRRFEDDVLPHYLHGNDSGWDNSTLFDDGAPLVAPELAAFLALQLETLAKMARKLDKPKAARRWRKLAKQLIKHLVEELWRGDRFVGIRRPGGEEVHCRSLITALPLILGDRLPEEVREALVEQMRDHLTEHGLATEHPDSEFYESDGYWRGPIWAPSTMLAVAGLQAAHEDELAREVAQRFCRMCAAEGFAENFDALSGESRRDPAYTWTSSVFLLLAHDCLVGDDRE